MSRQDTHRTLVAYDIPSDPRRTAIAKICERYGDRVQYSDFVVDLSPARVIRLQAELTERMVAGEDSILLCDLGPLRDAAVRRFVWLGQRRYITPSGPLVL